MAWTAFTPATTVWTNTSPSDSVWDGKFEDYVVPGYVVTGYILDRPQTTWTEFSPDRS